VQKIFSKAEEAGQGKLIDFDKESNMYFPSENFDDELVDIVDDYEEELFWDHLIYRMADRDCQKNWVTRQMNLPTKKRLICLILSAKNM